MDTQDNNALITNVCSQVIQRYESASNRDVLSLDEYRRLIKQFE